MPIYDRRCGSCAWEREDCYEAISHTLVCPNCGEATERVWRASPAVIGDDPFIGGKTFENLGHTPVTVHSRAEYKRELDKRGLREFVRHVGAPGSDKNRNTTRWV